MVPATYRLPTLFAGDTFDGVRLSLSSSNVAIDLTDATVEMVLADEAGVVVKTYTVGDGLEVTDALAGSVAVGPFTAPDTAGEYSYALTFTIDERVRTYLSGTMTVVGLG